MGSRAHRLQQLWHGGLVAPQHVGFSWTGYQTRVLCTGRWILIHGTTMEVPPSIILHTIFISEIFPSNFFKTRAGVNSLNSPSETQLKINNVYVVELRGALS